MANAMQIPVQNVCIGAGAPTMIQSATTTLGGSGTTTTVTFADLGLKDMANTSYAVILHPLGTFTAWPYVSARAAASFTITHDNGASTAIHFVVLGTVKAA